MQSNPPGNEYERLISLPVPELIKEYSDALDRFHEYLKKRGIEVPVVVAEALPEGSDPATSVFLEELTPASITAVNPSVITIYFSVKTFCALLSTLPESTLLDEVMISTSEGKAPLPAKKYRERAKSGAIKDDLKLSMSTDDALSIVAELEAAAKQEKAAPLDEADIEGVFNAAAKPGGETKRKLVVHADIAELPACSKLSYPMDFGPIAITQDAYNKLFSSDDTAQSAQEVDQDQLDTIISTAKAAEAETENAKDTKVDDHLSQDELDNLMKKENILSKEEIAEKSVAEDETATVSQSDLDALFAAGKTVPNVPEKATAEEESSTVSQADLDALFTGGMTTAIPAGKSVAEDETATVSQSDLDALFAAGKTAPNAPEKAIAEAESSTVSQADLDALFAGGKATAQVPEKPAENETATVSQSDLDALFAAGNTQDVATSAKEDMTATVSQADLDALFASNKPAVSKAETVKAVQESDKDGISQDEIDKAFNQNGNSKKQTKEPASSKNATVSQDELDILFKKA